MMQQFNKTNGQCPLQSEKCKVQNRVGGSRLVIFSIFIFQWHFSFFISSYTMPLTCRR